MRVALAVIAALSSGCYAGSTWTIRVRDPARVAVVRRGMREDPLTARLQGDDGVALAPGADDAEAVIANDPRRGRVAVTRRGGAVTLTCERCEGGSWTLLRASRWTMGSTDGRDPVVRGDPTVLAWHLDALSDLHAALMVGLATPRDNVAVIRRRETPVRSLGIALLGGAAAALAIGVYGVTREDVFFIAAGFTAGAGLLASGLWNVAAPPRVTDLAR